MSEWTLTELDEDTGQLVTYREDEDGNGSIEWSEDSTAILEANTALYNEHIRNPKAEWRHVARIPMTFLMKLRNEEGLDFLNSDDAKIIKKRYLNSSEFRKLRTAPGRL